jgi:serine/threonine-protein kinase RsbW
MICAFREEAARQNQPVAGYLWEVKVILISGAEEIGMVSVPPGPEGARQARHYFAAAFEPQRIAQSLIDDLLLAISEWLTNLGLHPDQKPSEVELKTSRIGNLWVLEILDDGAYFQDFELRTDATKETLQLNEGGMGLRLLQARIPAASYARDGLKNRLLIQVHGDDVDNRPCVLLVDDDCLIRTVYGRFLLADFRLLLADDSRMALQMLRHCAVDLIISDIQMPDGLSGLELCRRIRSDFGQSTLPLIFLTHDRTDEVRDLASDLAIDDFLIKPVRKDTLLSCAHRVLQRTRFVRNRLGNQFERDLTDLLKPTLPPRVGPFKAAVGSLSAEAGGGDLLYHHQGGGAEFLVFADLMGHGGQAKFFSHALAGYLSGMLRAHRTYTPSAAMGEINRAFHEDPHLTKTFATALALVLGNNGRVEICNGGHPLPLLFDADGYRPLGSSGPLPGINEAAAYESQGFMVAPGERLFLYSDGLGELGRDPQKHRANFDKICELIMRMHSLALQNAADCLLNYLEDLPQSMRQDDATFVMLEPA